MQRSRAALSPSGLAGVVGFADSAPMKRANMQPSPAHRNQEITWHGKLKGKEVGVAVKEVENVQKQSHGPQKLMSVFGTPSMVSNNGVSANSVLFHKTSAGNEEDPEGKEGGRWTREEDQKLRDGVKAIGASKWKRISEEYLDGKRSDVQCLHRWQKVLRPGLVKGPWTDEEDNIIRSFVQRDVKKWSEIAEHIPGRIGKQCRERWFNHLDPSIDHSLWTPEEEKVLVTAQAKYGNRWCKIAKLLPGRPENAVKNRWNSAIRQKWQLKLGLSVTDNKGKPLHPQPQRKEPTIPLPPLKPVVKAPGSAIMPPKPTKANKASAAKSGHNTIKIRIQQKSSCTISGMVSESHRQAAVAYSRQGARAKKAAVQVKDHVRARGGSQKKGLQQQKRLAQQIAVINSLSSKSNARPGSARRSHKLHASLADHLDVVEPLDMALGTFGDLFNAPVSPSANFHWDFSSEREMDLGAAGILDMDLQTRQQQQEAPPPPPPPPVTAPAGTATSSTTAAAERKEQGNNKHFDASNDQAWAAPPTAAENEKAMLTLNMLYNEFDLGLGITAPKTGDSFVGEWSHETL